MESKYYKVTCKCGHVGRGHFIRIDFPVKAMDGREASAIARELPRVKHHHKDAIIACLEITFEEFEALSEKNKYDPYLRCKNVQEQSQIADLALRIEPEAGYVEKPNKTVRHDASGYRRKKEAQCIRSYWEYDEDEWLAFEPAGLLA